MFRLEKLEISGFKSFADKTALIFGEGITGVVGPNGCGKSNIAESISWVLGEQSAKNLRGGKMEDVIFNGTRDRKPTGMAEVLLTMVAIEDVAARESEDDTDEEREFDEALNAAGRAAEAARELVAELAPEPQNAPADLPDQAASVSNSAPVANLEPPAAEQATEPATEAPDLDKNQKRRRSPRPPKRRRIVVAAGERVVVGRRLYRTGDSEYLINGKACLLRDIQDLFAGTGLGGAHYAIIEQGRIGQILSSKPLDRRALIEEAAGITKFKSRKRAAELKLESAKQNLTRLNDIISEVERQVNSLKRQAQKARRYRRLRDEMRSVLKIVFTADYYRLNEAITRIAAELENAERSQNELDQKLADLEAGHRAASTQSRAAEDNLSGLRERHASIELEVDRTQTRRAFEQQQIGELSTRVQELDRDQHTLESRLELLQQALDQRTAAAHQLEVELTGGQSELLRREAAFQEQTRRVRDADAALEQLRQRMLAEVGNTERVRNLRATIEDSLQKLRQRQSSLRAESERAAARLDETTIAHAGLVAELEQGNTQLEELNAAKFARASQLAETRQQLSGMRVRLDEASSERAAAEHRLRSLEDLDAHRAYYSDAVQHVLSPEQASVANALGTLADFVDVEPQYERLVESLFSRELQCMLVPTIDDALAGVDYIKAQGLGRGAFLVVGLHGGEAEEETGDGETRRRGDSETESDADTREQPGREVVFEVGETVPIERQLNPADRAVPEYLFEPPRPMTWPHVDEGPSGTPRFELEILRAIDLLGLRPEIKAVAERAFPDKCSAAIVPDIEAALQLSIENSARIYVTSDGEQVVNGRLIVTGGQAGQQGTSLLGLKREIKDLRIRAEVLGSSAGAIASECSAVAQILEGIEGEAAELDGRHRAREMESAALRSRIESLSQELDRARQHVRVVEADLAQAADESSELESRMTEVSAELVAAEASRESVQTTLSASQTAIGQMRAEAERLAEELSAARASVAALTERLTAARSDLRRIEAEAEELSSRMNRNRLELYDAHGRIENLTASLAEGEAAAARLESERNRLAAEITEASEHLTSSRALMDQMELELAALRQAVSAAHDRRGQIEVERARTQSEAEHLTRACLSELAMSIEDVVTSVELQGDSGQWTVTSGQQSDVSSQTSQLTNETLEGGASQTPGDQPQRDNPATDHRPPATDHWPLTTDNAQKRLEELRAKLDDIGPVNMMALEELEESEERFQFLSGQRTDILDSIKMTEEALGEIKRRSRERFRHAFHHINENFQQMFVELFGGGRGEMMLIDEDDVLESGIDLIAQPPGKRLQNVLLLSGGEKAMAAIALVLAIFQYRPSPFCILDEVDAPLDEVNVGRFSDKVIEMSRQTQFLVITHNKRTMEAARALYGVTMEELGVSKLVSVKFE